LSHRYEIDNRQTDMNATMRIYKQATEAT